MPVHFGDLDILGLLESLEVEREVLLDFEDVSKQMTKRDIFKRYNTFTHF